MFIPNNLSLSCKYGKYREIIKLSIVEKANECGIFPDQIAVKSSDI